jgi:excisionase family DNA binding protein
MTPKEAAERLNVSLRTVQILIKNGTLGHYRKGERGGKREVTERHLAAYLRRCEVNPDDAPAADPPALRRETIPDLVGLWQARHATKAKGRRAGRG